MIYNEEDCKRINRETEIVMKEKLELLWKKFVNRETISYVIFGVLTTAVNFVVYHLFCDCMGCGSYFCLYHEQHLGISEPVCESCG